MPGGWLSASQPGGTPRAAADGASPFLRSAARAVRDAERVIRWPVHRGSPLVPRWTSARPARSTAAAGRTGRRRHSGRRPAHDPGRPEGSARGRPHDARHHLRPPCVDNAVRLRRRREGRRREGQGVSSVHTRYSPAASATPGRTRSASPASSTTSRSRSSGPSRTRRGSIPATARTRRSAPSAPTSRNGATGAGDPPEAPRSGCYVVRTEVPRVRVPRRRGQP
jgi:hypothetical protein